MTVQEAIERVKKSDEFYHSEENKIIIQALEELEQYRALGTVEELKEAREKQIPKKPIEKEFYNMPHCSCPICEGGLYHEQQYCDECGQALEWEEEDDCS
jgi:hypothetical protein